MQTASPESPLRWADVLKAALRLMCACLPGAAVGRLAVVLALGFILASPARADVWGYVDAKGVAHFSAEKLDDRYELFFRGNESFSAGGLKAAPGMGDKATSIP